MKKTIYFLPLLWAVISSIYGMEQQPSDIQIGANLLLHLQQQVKRKKPQANNNQLLQSGKCPKCEKTFLNRGKPHPGNAKRHLHEICTKGKRPKATLRKKTKAFKKQHKKTRVSSDDESDFIPFAIHQCQLCTRTFTTKVRLNAHMSTHYEID